MTSEHALLSLYERERERLLKKKEAEGCLRGMLDQPIFGEGPQAPWLLLLGEAPGAEEIRMGRPFVGQAGRQLDALLSSAGIPREAVFITNTVKYRTVAQGARGMRNRTPAPDEIREGFPLLQQEIGILKPACIATLGNVPLSAMLALGGQKKGVIGDLHGTPKQIMLNGGLYILFPLYHPASILYNRSLQEVCEADAKALGMLYGASGSR